MVNFAGLAGISCSRKASHGVRVVMLALIGWAGSAGAQTLYRCGATYQDRPCASAESKVVGRSGAPKAEAAGGATAQETAPGCRNRGQTAQKIMWEKESGRTLDEQLGKRVFDPGLVQRVYEMRGSSLEVRKSIEAECMDDMKRAAQAAEMMRAANQLMSGSRGGAGDASAGYGGGRSESAAAPAAPVTRSSGRADGGDKGRACSGLSEELASLSNAQRAGGDVDRMERLAEQVRAVQSKRRAEGCR